MPRRKKLPRGRGKTSNQPSAAAAWRYWFVIGTLFLLCGGLIARLVYLNAYDKAFLQQQSRSRVLRTLSTPAYRGMITDRYGSPVAVSTMVHSVVADPKQVDPENEQLTEVASLLKLSPELLQQEIRKNHKKRFMYVKREISPYTARKIESLGVPGILLQPEMRRFYPQGKVMSQVVGFTDRDGVGQDGLEAMYELALRGTPGKRRVIEDGLGHVIADVKTLQVSQPGQKLVLSLDSKLQFTAYHELAKAVKQTQAESGSMIIMDVHTGEVLAMTGYPSFNPNDYKARQGASVRNRAVTDTYEPASTIKPFTIANALESGKYKPDTKIKTAPGWMMLEQHTIRDVRDHGDLDVSGVLSTSSNVGVSRISLTLPPESLESMLLRFGFGQNTGIGFPGERSGLVPHYKKWNAFVLATLAFGYGMDLTPLQLVQAYSTIADGGIKHQPTLLKTSQPISSDSVISAELSQTLMTMLRAATVKGGTGTRAQIPGVSIAGKTGTAHRVGASGYEKNRYNSTFVGIVPADKPKFAGLVVLYDVDAKKSHYYGGQIAAPVFARVMSKAVRQFNLI